MTLSYFLFIFQVSLSKILHHSSVLSAFAEVVELDWIIGLFPTFDIDQLWQIVERALGHGVLNSIDD